MIIACERARDFDRAGQWCEQLAAFCERTGQRPLLALCRAHHGTVLMMRGEWREAEGELAWASGELTTLRPPLAGYARARFAQLRVRQGRLKDARALVAQAGAHVLAPLVQAELALDEDDPSAALGYAERYLRGLGSEQPIESAAALELLVPIRIRLGELPSARAAHAQLATIAEAVATDSLQAAERHGAARIALADRDLDTACRAFEDALHLYLRSVAPLQAAQARLELAGALAAQGRSAAGLEHALTARITLDDLGAERAAKQADMVVAKLGGRSAAAKRAGMTAREVEVLTLVAEGLSNRQIAERLVVSEHTVHRHLANIYVRLGVSSRAAAVALAAERALLH
jgi:ATP/maltotriose-dependent transcriptional regulator MalT